MGFKKHNWSTFSYERRGTILKLEVFDEFERKLDSFFSNNPENHKKISRILRDKYGIDLNPSTPSKKDILKKQSNKENKSILDRNLEW